MRRFFGGYPPRYPDMLRLALAAALLRAVPLIPFFAVYLLRLGPWFKLALLLCPVLWVALVCPARIRYAEIMAAFAGDDAAPLKARELLARDAGWRAVCLGRIKLMRWWAMPLAVLLLFLLLLFIFANAFAALNILLTVFGGVATVIGTAAAFLPRLLMGEPMAQPAGLLGGIGVLAAVAMVCLCLFGWGAFRSSAYRFGYRAGILKSGELAPLLKNNLLLWMPTLALLFALLVLSYQELGLMLANIAGAEPLFSVKLQIHQIILASLAAVSYLLLLPLRKLNTAVWVQAQK